MASIRDMSLDGMDKGKRVVRNETQFDSSDPRLMRAALLFQRKYKLLRNKRQELTPEELDRDLQWEAVGNDSDYQVALDKVDSDVSSQASFEEPVFKEIVQHRREFYKIMSCFKTKQIPLTLFTRAVRSQTTWDSHGELCHGPPHEKDVVPACVRSLFTQYRQRYSSIQVLVARHLRFLSLSVMGGRRYLSISAHMREAILDNFTSEELLSSRFDALSITLISFPEQYSEILWEEVRFHLDDVLNSTIIPFLRVINWGDTWDYVTTRKTISYRLYYIKLMGFLISNLSQYPFLEYLSGAFIVRLSDMDDMSIAKAKILLTLHEIIRGRDLSNPRPSALTDVVQGIGRLSENINATVGIWLGNTISIDPYSRVVRVASESWKPVEPERPSLLERIAIANFGSSISIIGNAGLAGGPNIATLSNKNTPENNNGSTPGIMTGVAIGEEMGTEIHNVADASDYSNLVTDPMLSFSASDSLPKKTDLLPPEDLHDNNSSSRDIKRQTHVKQPAKLAPSSRGIITPISASISVEAKTLVGFVFARRKLYSLARGVLKDAIPEIRARYGPTSWEHGIAVAECVKCCNMTEQQRMGQQLARSTLLRRTGLEGRADSQYLQMTLADSLLAGSHYNGAIEILHGVVATERNDPSVVLKATIRLSKAHRRLGEIYPSRKITGRLVRGLQVLDQVNDELRSAFVTEIERNVSHTDTSNKHLHQLSQNIAQALSVDCNRRDVDDLVRKRQTILLKNHLEAIEELEISQRKLQLARSNKQNPSKVLREAFSISQSGKYPPTDSKVRQYPIVTSNQRSNYGLSSNASFSQSKSGRHQVPPTSQGVQKTAISSTLALRRCSPSIMGLWATATHRKFRASDFRFEVIFETPVIFLAPPTNHYGPIPNQVIHYIDGTAQSYEGTRVLPWGQDNQAMARVRVADDERASWVILLSTLQRQEEDSREWDAAMRRHVPPLSQDFWALGELNVPEYMLSVGIQRKTRSWDFMPTQITRPYATSAICHLIEMVAMLGMYWKVFDQTLWNLRAEGNGFILTSTNIQGLGVMAVFTVSGRSNFRDERVIPSEKVKDLVFGTVPNIFNDDDLSIEGNVRGLVLLFGSEKDVNTTLESLGCSVQTLERYKSNHKHMFSISFEIIGMLGKVLRIRGSSFRMIPNPTGDQWPKEIGRKATWQITRLMEIFQANLEEFIGLGEISSGGEVVAIMKYWGDVSRFGRTDYNIHIHAREAVHDALDQTTAYLRNFAPADVLGVLVSHITHVVEALADPSSPLNAVVFTHNEDALLTYYFHKIRPLVIGKQGPYGDDPTEAEMDKRNAIWVSLIFRMLCWYLLHDFNKEDVMIVPTDLKGSRMPVYIG